MSDFVSIAASVNALVGGSVNDVEFAELVDAALDAAGLARP